MMCIVDAAKTHSNSDHYSYSNLNYGKVGKGVGLKTFTKYTVKPCTNILHGQGGGVGIGFGKLFPKNHLLFYSFILRY